MKTALTFFAALAALLAASEPSFAHMLRPGQYDVGGLEQICIVSDGTWYSPTFITWEGEWSIIGNEDKAIIFGHYDDGVGDVGEDSILLEKGGLIDWTEWSDDFTDNIYNDDLPLTFLKKKCDPESRARGSMNQHKTPMK